MSITIFHTNDLHNKLTAGQVGWLRGLKESVPESILVDCGDAIWAGNIYVRPGGEPVLRLMNDAGYDAMCMGNREFHFFESGLRSKIGWADFPVLSANLRSTSNADLPVKHDIALLRNGLRVAMFGLTVPMITERMLSSRISAYVFDDAIETAARIVPELRKDADLVIALTHIGLNNDRRLAAEVTGIDLIVGGHTHAVLERPETVGNTSIVQAGWFAHYVGRVEIQPGGAVKGELLEMQNGK